jgi:hypothetical protein
MLNTHVTNLLDSSRGNPEDVPKVIEQLYCKVFIFQFRLNSYNLIEGRQGYVVRKIFVPDEKLEKEMFCTKNDEVTHEKNTDKELLNDKTNEVSFCNISIVYFLIFIWLMVYWKWLFSQEIRSQKSLIVEIDSDDEDNETTEVNGSDDCCRQKGFEDVIL